MVEYRLESNEIVTVTLEMVTLNSFTPFFPVSIQNTDYFSLRAKCWLRRRVRREVGGSVSSYELGEGFVGSFPEKYNNPKRPPSQPYFGVIGGEFSTLETSKTHLESPQLPLSCQTISNICCIVFPAYFFDPSLE